METDRSNDSVITPDELFLLIESTHWTHRHCAWVLGYDHVTLSRFVTAKRPIPDALTKKRVKQLLAEEFFKLYEEFEKL